MSAPGFLDRLREALAVAWQRAPASLVRKAQHRPGGFPLEPPPEGTQVRRIPPSDVRGSVASAGGGTVSAALPGVDVTLRIIPVSGGALHRVQGRAWRNPPGPTPLRVALVQEDHVLDAAEIDHGGRFQFEDLLAGGWSLEIHLERDRVVVLQGPPPA